MVGLSLRFRDLKFREKTDKLFEKINRERKDSGGIHINRQISDTSFEQEFESSNSK